MTRTRALAVVLLGAALIVVGVAMVFLPAALVAAGGVAMWFGLTEDYQGRPVKRSKPGRRK